MGTCKKSEFLVALAKAAKIYEASTAGKMIFSDARDQGAVASAAFKSGFQAQGQIFPILRAIKVVNVYDCDGGSFFPVYIACEAAWEFFENADFCFLQSSDKK
jgi:hypothetical protein